MKRHETKHDVNGNKTLPPFPEGTEMAMFGERHDISSYGLFLGGREEVLETEGVYSTQVGYSGGYTPNPTYKEVCTGR
ncbi:hypothetical protein INR49_004454 [Caranx melampygus]|nr:hypothetical protein INR49_004454 [Caranx melampygus]